MPTPALPRLPLRFPKRPPSHGLFSWEAIYPPRETLGAAELVSLAAMPGNTAKAHGQEYSSWLFFRLRAAAPDPAGSLRNFIHACWQKGWHTSLLQQLQQWRDYQAAKEGFADGMVPPDHPAATAPFGTVLLTRRTLRLLYPADLCRAFLAQDRCFREGMYAQAGELSDMPPGQEDPTSWKGYGYEQEFDLVLYLAGNRRESCQTLVDQAEALADKNHLEAVHRENGFRWRPEGAGTAMREPFGFRDGISNLLFLQDDIDADRNSGVTKWDASARWKNVLFLPENQSDQLERDMTGGSFVVLRKLEQNVAAFRDWEKQQARAEAGSGLVGRLRGGCPLAEPPAGGLLNNFNYEADPGGGACPFHAHIRRANPRGGSVRHGSGSLEEERSRLFVRRGMVYAPKDELTLADRPGPTHPGTRDQGVGLLFAAYMGKIEEQFLHMSKGWLHAANFPHGNNSPVDGLLGADWQGNPTGRTFVIPRGGGYFFAPPIPWARGLGP